MPTTKAENNDANRAEIVKAVFTPLPRHKCPSPLTPHIENLSGCYFGIATGKQCHRPPVWISVFDGIPGLMRWCDEHKPNPEQILSNNRHGVKRIQEAK